LSIITAVVLIGVEKLIAQEGTDEPQTEPGQRQVQEYRPRQRGRMERPRRQQVDSEERAGRAEAMRERRKQEGADKIEVMRKNRQQEALQRNRRQETAQKGAPNGRISREPQQSRPGQNLPMQPKHHAFPDR